MKWNGKYFSHAKYVVPNVLQCKWLKLLRVLVYILFRECLLWQGLDQPFRRVPMHIRPQDVEPEVNSTEFSFKSNKWLVVKLLLNYAPCLHWCIRFRSSTTSSTAREVLQCPPPLPVFPIAIQEIHLFNAGVILVTRFRCVLLHDRPLGLLLDIWLTAAHNSKYQSSGWFSMWL